MLVYLTLFRESLLTTTGAKTLLQTIVVCVVSDKSELHLKIDTATLDIFSHDFSLYRKKEGECETLVHDLIIQPITKVAFHSSYLFEG